MQKQIQIVPINGTTQSEELIENNIKNIVYWVNKRIEYIFNWKIKDIYGLHEALYTEHQENSAKVIRAWIDLKRHINSETLNYILNLK